MLPTPERTRRNRVGSGLVALLLAAGGAGAALLAPLETPVRIGVFAGAALAAVLAYRLGTRRLRRRVRLLERVSFPPHWRDILEGRVAFYARLDDPEKRRFERMALVFLSEVRLTGVRCKVDETLALLVASSAIIPIFGLPDWEYKRLGEVLIYPHHFDADFGADEATDAALGVVHGRGHAAYGTMVLSRPDLLRGFRRHGDESNVGIHEFAHLVDQGDGAIDGLPPGLPTEQLRPWMDRVRGQLDGLAERVDMNEYGFTNAQEFFAVLSEYFFEAPAKLAAEQPELYALLRRAYRQDPRARFAGLRKRNWRKKTRDIGRNDPCPCGSGEKYKRCCLYKHQDTDWRSYLRG